MLKLEPGELWHWTSSDNRLSCLYVIIGDHFSGGRHTVVCLVSELENGAVVGDSIRWFGRALFLDDGYGKTQHIA